MVLLCLGRLTFRRNSPSKYRLGQTTLSSITQYWTSGLGQNFLSSVCPLWGGRRTVWKVLLQCMLCSNQSSSFHYGVPVPPKRTVSKPDNLQFFLDQQAKDRSIVVFDWFNNLSSASHSDVSKGLIESYGEISYQDVCIHALSHLIAACMRIPIMRLKLPSMMYHYLMNSLTAAAQEQLRTRGNGTSVLPFMFALEHCGFYTNAWTVHFGTILQHFDTLLFSINFFDVDIVVHSH